MLSNIKNWLGKKFRKMTALQVVVFTIVFFLFVFYAFSILSTLWFALGTSLKSYDYYQYGLGIQCLAESQLFEIIEA